MKRAIVLLILGSAVLAASWSFTGEACAAERAVWVWGMTKDIVMDTAGTGAKKDFFDFCAAPHADAAKAITLVFFDAKPYGVNLMDAANAPKLRQFLAEAYAKTPRIKVEFLSGDPSWVIPQYATTNTPLPSPGETLIDDVITFNNGGGTADQRFSGIQYDVEPYLLNSRKGNDPLDWNYDTAYLWAQYLAFLQRCQAKADTYKATDPAFRFGAAIPRWYSAGSGQPPADIIDRVDYIAIMDYRDDASNIITSAQDEITYAATKNKEVYVGVETSHPTDTLDFPASTTFYEEGNAAMETTLATVESHFSGSSSYAGVAIHYYEDLAGPKGYEASYRRLWDASHPYKGHAPVVAVLSPSRSGEILVGTTTIIYEASDLDVGDSMTIDIQYSADGGANWTNIITGTGNSGSYAWDTSSVPTGANYLIKITATDTSANHLVGYDVSNAAFSIARSVTQSDISDLKIWNESATSIRLKWTPPACTPQYYKIYRSVNGAGATLYQDNLIAVNKYIDTGVTAPNKYKYQVRGVWNGTPGPYSNYSSTLVPGNEFLIDYCEGTEGITYDKYGDSTLTYAFDTTDKKEGTRSAKFVYTYTGTPSNPNWGAIRKGTLPMAEDVSPYNAVKLWAKGGAVGNTAIKFQLAETGRSEGNEMWESAPVAIASVDWTEYEFKFSDFVLADVQDAAGNSLDPATHGNLRIDTHSIGAYGLIFGKTTASGTYYVDQIRLETIATVPESIGVPHIPYVFEDPVGSGQVVGIPGNHRFRIGPIPVTYSGLTPPWTIRIWTNNGGSKAGLVGVADPSEVIPLKVWCANYGPTAMVPDEEDDAYWIANATGWFRVPEYSEMDPLNKYSWRRLCWISGQDASLGNPFDIYLAIDVEGKKPQQYTTNTLTVECINQ